MNDLQPGERLIFANDLGVVTDRRLMLPVSRSVTRDIPLGMIATIDETETRHPAVAALFALIGLAAATRGSAGIILGVVLLALAVLAWFGAHAVVVRATHGGETVISGRRFKPAPVHDLAAALRQQRFTT